MIEKMFPQTVSNIIDYDAIKAAAKKYVEDVFVEIVKSFGDNLILQTMDEAHLAEVSKHVAGGPGLSIEDLLSYMNTDNIYRESEFVSDLLTAFPSGVEYLEFEVTGWKFPQVDFVPFNDPERSYNYDGTPASGAGDDIWMDNAFEGYYVNNLLMSRYRGQFGPNAELNWHKKSGRRSSWGDPETWMTTGGFGKPASIHINVDEERTVLEENGLSSVENWLGTVANKLPINLYIEINDIFKMNGEDTAGSTNGYRQSFPYAEGEGFCTNDPAMAVSPEVVAVTYTVSYANTQLPDVQIELPESEIVEDGYSIILPTMTGEYESGGKTWTPSAWDIGAFGDSYTPSADTVAHLIFEEVFVYTFIVADATTGQIVSGFSNELVYGEIEGIVLQSPKLIYGVDITVPTIQFWFTENGRNETENTVLQPNSTVTVFDENGDTITDEDTIGMYDTESVLAYMRANGDMISKQDDVLIDNDGELGLQVDSGPISAWSVFAERVFTLSFANTQLPDITITMPADETGYKGTSITLPTMSGEYESGGKTWKPSAWDIGAFGSSYTLNADTVAHLIFEEVQQYQEITLYMASGSKSCQLSVSSSFTGNVNSERVYQLYTDEQCTTPWTGYDYSNDYEVGRYVGGEWNRYTDSVSAMPSSTAIYGIGYILMDTGALWLCCNSRSSTSVTITSIVVRIYPKDQQQYSLYFSQNSNTYNNYSTSGGMVYKMKHRPGNPSYGWLPWSNSFPTRTIVKALYSSGKSNIAIDQLSFNRTDDISIKTASDYAPSFRNVIFTLDVPTYTSWANLSGNKSAESNEVCPLFDRNGEYVVYDPMMKYTIIGLFNYSGGHPFNSPNRFMLDARLGAFDTGNPTRLCFKLNRAVTFSYVWYIKTPIS